MINDINKNFIDLQNEIREIAKELLENNKVSMVIGYGESTNNHSTIPIFINNAVDVSKLTISEHIYHNLTVYLTKPFLTNKNVAIVLTKTGLRSLIGLINENQIQKDNVTPIIITKSGCKVNDYETNHIEDFEFFHSRTNDNLQSLNNEIEKLKQMTAQERFDFWKNEFSRCIRCYACRQICPHCFCKVCIVEKSMPQWISSTPVGEGNFAWNIIRAYHLVGRCVECMECSRACPVGIRLDLLNRFLCLEVEDAYNFISGASLDKKPPLTTYELKDNQDFIK